MSATDSHLVAERRLITKHARGLQRTVPVAEVTTGERLVAQGYELLGITYDDHGTPVTVHANGEGGMARDSPLV